MQCLLQTRFILPKIELKAIEVPFAFVFTCLLCVTDVFSDESFDAAFIHPLHL